VAIAFASMAIPYNIFRPDNQIEWRFAARKIEVGDAIVADQAIAETKSGRIVANDPISSIIAMHENHPPLVNVREFYIDLLAQHMPHADYVDRKLLTQFTTDQTDSGNAGVASALDHLNVGTVVIVNDAPSYKANQQVLSTSGFHLSSQSGSYAIWTKTAGPSAPRR
jgi:hypothetical protein